MVMVYAVTPVSRKLERILAETHCWDVDAVNEALIRVRKIRESFVERDSMCGSDKEFLTWCEEYFNQYLP